MKKKILVTLIIVAIIGLIGTFFFLFFKEQRKNIVKQYIFYKVETNKETLEEAIEQIVKNEIEAIAVATEEEFYINYEELDIDVVTKIFEKLKLTYVSNYIDNPKGEFIEFVPKIGTSLFMWEGHSRSYSYSGFYYSKNDEAIDVFYEHEKCEKEFDNEWGFIGKYHYKTERIDTNWWYYEVIVDIDYNVKGR